MPFKDAPETLANAPIFIKHNDSGVRAAKSLVEWGVSQDVPQLHGPLVVGSDAKEIGGVAVDAIMLGVVFKGQHEVSERLPPPVFGFRLWNGPLPFLPRENINGTGE